LNAVVVEHEEPGLLAERPAVILRAKARPRGAHDHLWPHWLPHGADEYRLVFDLEWGHLLSFAGFVDGQELERSEVIEIAYGETFDDALFTLT